MKKTIGYFVCSNGYGHFVRTLNICKHLQTDYNITIYCEKYQYDKFKPDLECTFKFYDRPNIRWDDNDNATVRYSEWLVDIKDEFSKYDHTISDNLLTILSYRPDTIIIGSFLWGDVYKNILPEENIITVDEQLMLVQYRPTIVTNKYVETGYLKKYGNKIGFGWGCEDKPKNIWGESDHFVLVEPSLDYLPTYKKVFKKIKTKIKNTYSTSINKTDNCTYIIRPGVGMLTHCVENYIPIIALYDENDSKEIIELSKRVEELGIGKSVNISKEIDYSNLLTPVNNDIYNKVSFEKNGYLNIAQFLKNKLQ